MAPPAKCLSAAPQCFNHMVVILITSYIICKIFKSQSRIDGMNKIIFRTTMAFMAFNWLFTLNLIAVGCYSFYWCMRSDIIFVSGVLGVVTLFLFAVQNYLLLIALFCRLYGLYEAGPLRLSKRITYSYIAVFCLMALGLIIVICLCIPVAATPAAFKMIRRISGVLMVFATVSVLISLLWLFRSKMKQIQSNERIAAFAHRQQLLSILTVIGNVLCTVSVVSRWNKNEGQWHWMMFLRPFFSSFHIICNFLCIGLPYRCCDTLVVLCCGFLRCCTATPITTEDHDAIFLEQMLVKPANTRPAITAHQTPSARIEQRENPSVGGAAQPSAFNVVYEY